jgi:dienelactone hydrolase
MKSTLLLLGALLLNLPHVIKADPQAPRVFAANSAPDDQRLREAHDVDHPVMFTPHYKDKADWQRRADRVRQQVLVAEGLWPLPVRTPLNPVIHGRIDRDDYTIEKVFFASYPGHYVSGNLYRPKNRAGKLPAVLSPHGHWAGGRFYECPEAQAHKQIADGAETTMEGARFPIQARCAMLARMGCVVFQYDMVGYADSTAIEHRTGFTDAQAVLHQQSFMGLQTWNSIRALDFLQNLPDVDPGRIAVTGASGGGTQTLILCAIDPRPAVAFPAVMVSEEMQGGCICENAPLLRVDTNNVELAALFAPKPLGMSAANDWTRALETKGLPELKTIFGLFGAQDLVMARHFSFEHNYNQVSRELMYNWMNDHLKLGWPSTVKEKSFEPVPPKALSVYDEQHPRPADSCDAATLRKYMTDSSNRQLADLARSDPGNYRSLLRTALGVMVHDQFPAEGQIVVSRASGPRLLDGAIIETGALGRRDAHEAVPYVSLVPSEWNGTVVAWVDADGKSSLFDRDGKPAPDIRQLLDEKIAVIGADLFLTGEFTREGHPASAPANADYEKQHYAGFSLGYNRGILANRVHDLLTELAFARQWKGTKAVNVVAPDNFAPIALLARALAGDSIDSCAVNLSGFDFDQIKDSGDPMMLPGASKYGGIYGLAAACDSGRTLIAGAAAEKSQGGLSDHLTLQHGPADAPALIHWLLNRE